MILLTWWLHGLKCDKSVYLNVQGRKSDRAVIVVHLFIATILEYVLHYNWSFSSIPSSSSYIWEHPNYNITQCLDTCRGWTRCVAWSYWHDLARCKFVVAEPGIVQITYDIVPMEEMVTHGYKSEYNGKIFSNREVSV